MGAWPVCSPWLYAHGANGGSTSHDPRMESCAAGSHIVDVDALHCPGRAATHSSGHDSHLDLRQGLRMITGQAWIAERSECSWVLLECHLMFPRRKHVNSIAAQASAVQLPSNFLEPMGLERFLMREGLTGSSTTISIAPSSGGSPEAHRWRSNRCRSTGKHHPRQNAYAALDCQIALAVHSGRPGKDGRNGGAFLRCVSMSVRGYRCMLM